MQNVGYLFRYGDESMMQRVCNLSRIVSDPIEGFGFYKGGMNEDIWSRRYDFERFLQANRSRNRFCLLG